ncbi:ATP-dependent DNA ligase [Candidatus Microgenomates bacterium]|nr:ATP-dependent DNA ligase [Candidatus Microgenomates bacterium]
MKFSELSIYLQKLEDISSRIEITKILVELFKKSDSSEIGQIVNLTLGQLAPSFKSIVFNVAEKMMIQSLAIAYDETPEEILKLYKLHGDLGNVSATLNKNKDTSLTVKQIFEQLVEIAQDEGEGSVDRKIQALATLLKKVDSLSSRFLTRIPVGRLRLGFSDKTIIDALSWMHTGDKSLSKEIEKAYFVVPDIALLAKEIKQKGIKEAVKNITPILGTPVLPMLAQRVKSPTEMIEKMTEVAIEPKFDGLRAQIHFDGKNVKVFTRNLNDVSWMFPELANTQKFTNAKKFIVDTEAVGVSEETKQMANFQTTMTRRRKHDIEKYSSSIPIQFNVFDVVLVNNKSLMDETYLSRRKHLDNLFKANNLFLVDQFIVTKDPKVIDYEMQKELSEGLEGVLIKKTDSKYIAGRTGYRWVKLKESENQSAKLADTIDAVVMGYTAGKGKRAGFGVGQFLVGVVDKDKIKTITKIGTGLTDDQFRELKQRLTKLEVKDKPKEYEVDKILEPDFWVIPSQVVEIAADEITKSPNHTAGLALRFPRLIKFRDDKSIKQATNLKELKSLYNLQKVK